MTYHFIASLSFCLFFACSAAPSYDPTRNPNEGTDENGNPRPTQLALPASQTLSDGPQGEGESQDSDAAEQPMAAVPDEEISALPAKADIPNKTGVSNSLLMQTFLFPLASAALADYKQAPRSFGSCRDSCTRRHAAADLYASTGTVIHSIGEGEILDFYEFYLGTYALIVDYGAFIVRYGEIKGELPYGIHVGAKVKQGQTIAHIGRLTGLAQDMLHFEKYRGIVQGPLTNRSNPPFLRRQDLVNPTADLVTWKYPK